MRLANPGILPIFEQQLIGDRDDGQGNPHFLGVQRADREREKHARLFQGKYGRPAAVDVVQERRKNRILRTASRRLSPVKGQFPRFA